MLHQPWMHSRKGKRNSTWKSVSTRHFLLQTEHTVGGSHSALALLPPLLWYMQELEKSVLSKTHLLNFWEETPLISWGHGMSFAFPAPTPQSPRHIPEPACAGENPDRPFLFLHSQGCNLSSYGAAPGWQWHWVRLPLLSASFSHYHSKIPGSNSPLLKSVSLWFSSCPYTFSWPKNTVANSPSVLI